MIDDSSNPNAQSASANIRNMAMIVALLGMFMSVLDSVVITIALPAITSDFNADISLSQWTITGYLTAMTASIRLSASTLQSVVFFTILPQQSNNPNKIIIKVRYH